MRWLWRRWRDRADLRRMVDTLTRENACIEQHRTQDSSIMKGPAEMSAPMLGSLLVAVAGWCLAAYLSIKLWAANDYIRLLQANKTHQTDAE